MAQTFRLSSQTYITQTEHYQNVCNICLSSQGTQSPWLKLTYRPNLPISKILFFDCGFGMVWYVCLFVNLFLNSLVINSRKVTKNVCSWNEDQICIKVSSHVLAYDNALSSSNATQTDILITVLICLKVFSLRWHCWMKS